MTFKQYLRPYLLVWVFLIQFLDVSDFKKNQHQEKISWLHTNDEYIKDKTHQNNLVLSEKVITS